MYSDPERQRLYQQAYDKNCQSEIALKDYERNKRRRPGRPSAKQLASLFKNEDAVHHYLWLVEHRRKKK